jgi:hypothetical protein
MNRWRPSIEADSPATDFEHEEEGKEAEEAMPPLDRAA